MKIILFIYALVISFPVLSQEQEIYHLTFSDITNFEITTSFGNKRPDTIYIIDSTKRWDTRRFWLEELDGNFPHSIKKMERDEHHPFFHTYLFRDKDLDRMFSKEQKKSLSIRSQKIVSKTIDVTGKNYKTIPSSENITGFYFVSTEPIFTNDGKYAFIDLTVYRKELTDQEMLETYFGKTCVIFVKDDQKRWRKIKLINHLIL